MTEGVVARRSTVQRGYDALAPRFGRWMESFDAETNRRLVREAGFELLVDGVVRMREPEGETAFLWVLARRPPVATAVD
jgi:hypothetical protein